MGTKIETYDLSEKMRVFFDNIFKLEDSRNKKFGVIYSDNEKRIQGVEASVGALSDDETRDEIYTYDTTYPDNIIKEEVKLSDGTVIRTVDYIYSNPEEGVIGSSVKKYKNEKLEQVTVTKNYFYNTEGSITKVSTVKTVVPAT